MSGLVPTAQGITIYSIGLQISSVITKHDTNMFNVFHRVFPLNRTSVLSTYFITGFSQQMLHYFSILKFLCSDSSNACLFQTFH